MDPLIILFGLGVGILIGMTGVGGGSLMTPLLILVFGIKPVVAIGTDLAYGALTKTLGGWRHLRKGTVDLGLALWLAVGSWPGAVVGVLRDRVHPAPLRRQLRDVHARLAGRRAVPRRDRAAGARAVPASALIARERDTVEMTPRDQAHRRRARLRRSARSSA